MADEPAVPVSRVSDAHDDNGGQREPSCTNLIDAHSSTMLSDHRKVMLAHDADFFMAARGLEPSRASDLAPELLVSASPAAFSVRPLSSGAQRAVPATSGLDHPADARCDIVRHRRTDGAVDSVTPSGETRLANPGAAGATAARVGTVDPAAEYDPRSDGRDGLQLHEVGVSSLLAQQSAVGLGAVSPVNAVDEPPAPAAGATCDRLSEVGATQMLFSRGRSSHASPSGAQDFIPCPHAISEPPRASVGSATSWHGARYAASRHAPLPRIRACFDSATQAVMMAPGQFSLHSRSLLSAKALKPLSVIDGEYRNWRGQFDLLLTTVGITHLLGVVGTVVRGNDGAHYVYSFAAELYPAFSFARTLDAIVYALLCVAYDGPFADEARLQGRTLRPSSGYRAIEFLDRVNRSTVWQLKQLQLKPQQLRLNGGDVLSFLKEAQLLRTRLMSEGLEPRDTQMLEQLEDQWHRWYRKQPSNGMIIELNDTVTHAIACCEGQFDTAAQAIQTWAQGEGDAIRWDILAVDGGDLPEQSCSSDDGSGSDCTSTDDNMPVRHTACSSSSSSDSSAESSDDETARVQMAVMASIANET